MEHPDPIEIKINQSELLPCPECGGPFEFSTKPRYDAFTNGESMAVVVLECPECGYTLPLHLMLVRDVPKLDDEEVLSPPDLSDDEAHAERARARARALAAGVTAEEWERGRLDWWQGIEGVPDGMRD